MSYINWNSRSLKLAVGIGSLLVGLVAFLLPELILIVPVLLFGAYAAFQGGRTVFRAWEARPHNPRWGWQFAWGSLGLLAGLFALVYPGLTLISLLLFVAAWAVLHGIHQIRRAFELRHRIPNEWLLGLSGALSILFGIYVFFAPEIGALTLAWIIGFNATLLGAFLVTQALRQRNNNHPSQGLI